jgi:wyosine [tRNA(Phe)-imidazoG37] synthetase (radical SAM superfamily)
MGTETGPYVFPLPWFHKMLESIQRHDVRLDRIAYVGRGEPTLNRQFTDMITHARRTMPNLTMSMDTNSNQPFKDEYLQLNWMNCSIDGSDQATYGPYRRGGKFEKAVSFLQDAADRKRATGSNCQVRWKYILFDVNDSDECLNRAQQIARDIGVDELDLIITHCGSFDQSVNPSRRFTTVASVNDYIQRNNIFNKTMCSRAT